jgi:hypothetical protein
MSSLMQHPPFISDWNDPPDAEPPDRGEYRRRALLIWPGLDRQRLRHTQGDPWRIAGLVSARTSLSMEAILVLLMGPELDAHQAHPGHRAHARSPA